MYISKSILTEYRTAFPTVCITTRDVNSTKAQELAALGAEMRPFQESLSDVLAGADVVISALPTDMPQEDVKQVTAAIAASSAKVYFMSEYGV